MTWRAFLRGDADDLDALGHQYRSGDVTIEPYGEDWVLTAAHWNADVDFTVVRDEADALVRRLNAVARMLDEDFGAVELTGRYTDGRGTHQVVLGGAATVRARAGRATVVITDAPGNIVPPPAPPPPAAPGYIGLAQRNAQVDEVLDLFAKPGELGWVLGSETVTT